MREDRALNAQHIIQRSGASCFPSADDRCAYLDQLTTFAPHYECAVHAYVLMGNHVHILTTSPDLGGIRLVLAVRERYQRYVAERYGSDEAMWSEEPEIRQVHARRYLLACMRYIELNPVRAQIAGRADDYRWSSYRANALGFSDPIVTPHPLYYALGRSPEARRAAYARFVRRGFARPGIASP
jgi:putative transposase